MMVASAATLPAACAAPTRYAGIDLRPGGAPADVQQLAVRAQADDKAAQLELGIRYEEGWGVARDLDRARRLYTLAASADLKPRWTYTPAVGNAPAGVVPLPARASGPGLVEARTRLARLDARSGAGRK